MHLSRMLRMQCHPSRVVLFCAISHPSLCVKYINSKSARSKDDGVDAVKQADKLDSFVFRIHRVWKNKEKAKGSNISQHISNRNGVSNVKEERNNKVCTESSPKRSMETSVLCSETKDKTASSLQDFKSENKPNQVMEGTVCNASSKNYEEEAQNHSQIQLSERTESLLCEILYNVQYLEKDQHELESSLRLKVAPSFGSLRRTCAWASRSNHTEVVQMLKELTHLLYPKQYKENLCFNYYLASSLCYAGQVEAGLAELSLLYHQQLESHKKVRDTTNFIIYHLISAGQEEYEQLILSFVNNVAEHLGELGPALTLWRATFCSSLYRQRQMADSLLERHPKLAELLERKVPGMVARAVWEWDEALLRRILQLILQLQLTHHYYTATTALLQLQCDLDDLGGAEETLKFSQQLGIQLPPAAVARMLALLARHRHPAPLALLALKYLRPLPPSPIISKPPKFKFKF